MCREMLPVENFPVNKAATSGYDYKCSACRRKHYPYKKGSHFLSKYGISMEDYNSMIVKQQGLCAICKEVPAPVRGDSLYVDHCHTTGDVRGLLCNSCNIMLGMAKDNIETLRKAIDYLNRN